MLKSLEKMQLGLLTPKAIQNAETYKRASELQRDEMITFNPCSSRLITCSALSLDGQFFLCGGHNGKWYIYKVPNHFDTSEIHVPLLKSNHQHDNALRTCQWFPTDNGIFTTSAEDGNIFVWDVTDLRKPVDEYGLCTGKKDRVNQHDLNPTDPNLIAGNCMASDMIMIFDMRVGSCVLQLDGSSRQKQSHLQNFSEVRWSPRESNHLAIGSRNGALSQYDIRSPIHPENVFTSLTDGESEGFTNSAHGGRVLSVQYSASGNELFSFGEDGVLNRFDTHSSENISALGVCKNKVENMNYMSIRVCSELPSIVYLPCNKRIHVVDMTKCKTVNVLKCFGIVNQFVFDERMLQGISSGISLHMWGSYTTSQNLYKLERDLEKRKRREMLPLIDTLSMD